MEEPRQLPDESMEVSRLLAVWRGEADDAYAEAAIVGTLAIALRAMGLAPDIKMAQSRAEALWRGRDHRPPARGLMHILLMTLAASSAIKPGSRRRHSTPYRVRS